jgi:outer membrane protein assembly factor BamB
MRRTKTFVCNTLIALAACGLSACGGGGSGGSVGADNSWLSFTPGSIDVTTYPGESQTITIRAKSSKTIAEKINIGIIDAKGVLATDTSVSAISNTEYAATLRTSSALAAGTYTGSVEVRICLDDPIVCQKPYSGSPWQLPYKIVVNNGTDLKPLSVWPQVPAWSTYQGNASHTGLVPATTDAAAFSRRWLWANTAASSTAAVSSVAVDSGVVFAVTGTRFGSDWTLWAISENTGSVLWKYAFGSLFNVNPPAAANGKVFVTSTGHQDTFFWVFDQQSGALLTKQARSSQWENYLAPTVHGTEVYTETGSYGGMTKFDTATNTFGWTISLPQYDTWTPAVDNTYAYAYVGSSLHAVRKSDGVVDFTIADPQFSWAGYTVNGAVALGNDQSAYTVQYGLTNTSDDSRLIGFDLAKHSIKWQQSGKFRGNPVLAGDVIYVVNNSALEARRSNTGALLWTWTAPDGFNTSFLALNDIVATNNLVFVSAKSNVYAIDTNSHTSVWKYPQAGKLAISSNGVLYISTLDGKLIAVNLK